MNTLKKSLLFSLLFCITFAESGFSQNDTPGNIIYDYEGIENGSVEFYQIYYYGLRKIPDTFQVKLKFKKINSEFFSFNKEEFAIYNLTPRPPYNVVYNGIGVIFISHKTRSYRTVDVSTYEKDYNTIASLRSLPCISLDRYQGALDEQTNWEKKGESWVSESQPQLRVNAQNGRIEQITFFKDNLPYKEYIFLSEKYNDSEFANNDIYNPDSVLMKYPDYEPFNEEKHGEYAVGHLDSIPFPLVSSMGDTLTREDLIGKPTLIYLWYMSCYPCRRDLPKLEEFYLEHKDELNFVGFNISDDFNFYLNSFLMEKGVTFPNFNSIKIQLLSSDCRIRSSPDYWLFDSTGKLCHAQDGSGKKILKITEKMIKAQKK